MPLQDDCLLQRGESDNNICRIFNRQIVSEIVATAHAEKQAEEQRKMRTQGNTLNPNSLISANNTMSNNGNVTTVNNPSSPSRVAPHPTATNNYEGSPLKAISEGPHSPISFKSKTRDVMSKIHDVRAKDQRTIKETVSRHKELREQRFERLMRNVTGEDIYLRSDVTELLRLHNIEQSKRRAENFQNWNTKVYDSIQKQMDRMLNPVNRSLVQSISGVKNVEFLTPDTEQVTFSNNYTDNPSYVQLNKHHQESSFRKKMDQILEPKNYATLSRQYSNQDLDDDMSSTNLVMNQSARQLAAMSCGSLPRDPRYAKSRPVLEPELWEQLKLQGTPFGHFAQVCGEGPGFKTSVKMGNHAPPEYDGVPAAGKKKTRWVKNDVGILKGEIATRGTTIEFKNEIGCSSGAPAQDHFTYEQNRTVTDNEFPLGKRMMAWKH